MFFSASSKVTSIETSSQQLFAANITFVFFIPRLMTRTSMCLLVFGTFKSAVDLFPAKETVNAPLTVPEPFLDHKAHVAKKRLQHPRPAISCPQLQSWELVPDVLRSPTHNAFHVFPDTVNQ